MTSDNPHLTRRRNHRDGRPLLGNVPLNKRFVTWMVEAPESGSLIAARYIEKTVRVVDVLCQPCALMYRAYEDDPRPCPGCHKSPKF